MTAAPLTGMMAGIIAVVGAGAGMAGPAGMAGHRPVGLFGMVGHRPVAPAGMAGLPPADPAGMADRRREAPVVPGLVPVADACPSNRSGNKPFMKEARRSAPPGSIVLRSDQRLTKTT